MVHRDLNYKDFYKKIQTFAGCQDHFTSDMAVVVIMSHGNKDGFISHDCKVVSRNWVMRQFAEDLCLPLLAKPKLFIFQACRSFFFNRAWALSGLYYNRATSVATIVIQIS